MFEIESGNAGLARGERLDGQCMDVHCFWMLIVQNSKGANSEEIGTPKSRGALFSFNVLTIQHTHTCTYAIDQPPSFIN